MAGASAAAYPTGLRSAEAGRLSGVVEPPVSVESGGGPPATVRPGRLTGYDTFGDQTQQRDERANVTSFQYDVLGRRTGAAYPTYVTPGGATVNASESWAYDAAGNVTRWTDRRGKAAALGIDLRAR